MCSHVSSILANIYIEELETRPLEQLKSHQGFGKRYVNDTFLIQDTNHKDKFQ